MNKKTKQKILKLLDFINSAYAQPRDSDIDNTNYLYIHEQLRDVVFPKDGAEWKML